MEGCDWVVASVPVQVSSQRSEQDSRFQSEQGRLYHWRRGFTGRFLGDFPYLFSVYASGGGHEQTRCRSP
jgi:hypothetical protein